MANNIVRFDGQNGVEILIDTVTGESFASIKGYARMSGLSKQAISKRLQGVNETYEKTAEVLTPGGLQGVRLISEDLICEWLPKDNPVAAKTLLKLGVRMALHTMAGYEVKSSAVSQKVKGSPYTDRLKELGESLKCPKGFWSVIQQSPALLMMVEKLYPVTDLQLLDGSIGIRWGSFRKGQSWAKDSSSANYTFSDHRGKVQIKAYANSELGYYRDWEEDVYVPKFLPVYLQERYKALVAK